ncbi:MAG: PIN domain-containing protein, partial [Nanoarchaeota archaeon]
MMFYIDANIFILAALYQDKKAIKAREIIKKTIEGQIIAATSSLTIDEVVWKVWKETKNRKLAIEQGSKILQFDNLKII